MSTTPAPPRRPRASRYDYLAPPVALLLTLTLLFVGWLDRIELLTVDRRFQWRAPSDPPAHPDIILVTVDEESLQAFQGWPWPREVHGDLLTLLKLAEPSVVTFDILFTEPREMAGDTHFAEMAAQMPQSVVTAAKTEPGVGPRLTPPPGQPDTPAGLTLPVPAENLTGKIDNLGGANEALPPFPALATSSLFGFANATTTPDGVRRTLPALCRWGGHHFPSLAVQTLLRYWDIPPANLRLRLDSDSGEMTFTLRDGTTRTVPLDANGEIPINYRRKTSFQCVSYAALVQALAQHYINNEPLPPGFPELKGKILVIGLNAPGLPDMGPSPIEGDSPLVLTHLGVINSILNDQPLRTLPTLPVILAWLIAAWASLFAIRTAGPIITILVPILILAAYLGASHLAFQRASLLWPVAWPTIAFLGLHSGGIVRRWLEEKRSRRFIQGVFGSYLGGGVMQRIIQKPESIHLGGERKPVTIFFSDIRGFTRLSEMMSEENLVALLNEYFEHMVECVNQQQGTLHKYIGDAIMVVWGDILPSEPAQDAIRAVRASLAMRDELARLNRQWEAQGRPPLAIGIGLNHGEVLVGNIGALQRKEFTVIGDAVNLASRIEGLTKQFKSDLLVGESVHALLPPGLFHLRTAGVIILKGKTRPVRVFQIFGEILPELPDADRDLSRWIALYESAFSLYLAGDFPAALAQFHHCLALRPGDYLCELYSAECRRLATQPTPPDWQGVLVMQEK